VPEVQAKLERLAQAQYTAVLEAIGAFQESRVRRRIRSGKTSYDGVPWAQWSDRYAKTRHGNQSLLLSNGDLLDSIQWSVDGNSVEISSNLAYAATHQYGDDERGIPARPFLDFADTDEAKITQLVQDYVTELLRGGA
jgi:phage virion morphogenesis protein